MAQLTKEKTNADTKNEYKNPTVIVATDLGHTEIIKTLLQLNYNPNAPISSNATALMETAREGHGNVVGVLLEHGGVDLDAVDSEGETALMCAAESGHAAVARQLVDAEANTTLHATDDA